MRVLLIEPPPNPNWMLYPHTPWVGVWMPNTGLIRIASALHKAGHQVKVAEVWAQKLSTEKLRRMIQQFQPDVVGATAITATVYSAMSYLKFAKQVRPEAYTLIGGVHPTMAPKEVISSIPEIDFAIVGEGEVTVVELVGLLEKGRVAARGAAGIAYDADGQFVKNEARPLVENLDDLGMPEHQLFSIGSRRYRFPNVGPLWLRSPAWGVEYTRGCEFDCKFCVKPVLWRMTLRYRSEEQVCDELELITRKYGVKSGQLFANDIFARRDRLEELIIQMEKRRINYRFVTFGRADTVMENKDLLPRLVKLGLVMFWIGVESLEQDVLDHISKKTTARINKEVLKVAEEAGVPVLGPFYMMGFPEHDLKAMQSMRKEALEAIPRFSPGLPAFTPTPGTPLYYEVARKGLIEHYDYSKWDVGGAVIRTEHISSDVVNRESRKLGMRAVFRPSFVWGQLTSGTLHGFLQAFMGPAVALNMVSKRLSRVKNFLVKMVRSWFKGPDQLEMLYEEARQSTMVYAEEASKRVQATEPNEEATSQAP